MCCDFKFKYLNWTFNFKVSILCSVYIMHSFVTYMDLFIYFNWSFACFHGIISFFSQPLVYVQLTNANLEHMILAGTVEEAMDIVSEDVSSAWFLSPRLNQQISTRNMILLLVCKVDPKTTLNLWSKRWEATCLWQYIVSWAILHDFDG